MKTIHEQLEWEEDMVLRGVTRFRNQQDRAVETRAHETSAGNRLLRAYVIQISDHLSDYLAGKHPSRKRTRYARLLDTIDTDKVAMFALRFAIGAVFSKGHSMQGVCISIGMACEDELRLSKFHAEHMEYYEAVERDFERKRTTSYSHRRRVLIGKASDKNVDWKEWTRKDAMGVGAIVLGLLMEVCNLVEKAKVKRRGMGYSTVIRPTADCMDWIKRHNSIVELTSPDRMPSIVEPAKWISPWDGGYYSSRLRGLTPLVKARSKDNVRDAMLEAADMPVVYDAVNALQETPWEINSALYDIMAEVWTKNLGCGMPRAQPYEFPVCPLSEDTKAADLDENSKERKEFAEWKSTMRELHVMERDRAAKNLSITRTLRMAREMRTHGRFWYVYQLDSRGRAYTATTGLSPQGTDQSKALIQFADKTPVSTEEEKYWFFMHGANKFGIGGSFADRIEWVVENQDQLLNWADNPLSDRGWAEADKPWCFLAWCLEFREFVETDGTFHTALPLGQDGSCNGLQHFSAMLRDSIGGKAVNLVPSDTPQDIYQNVADVATSKLALMVGEVNAAANWYAQIEGKMKRSLPKKPVMTMPYGSTRQACTSSIYAWAHENVEFPKNTAFKHSIFLTPIIWDSIGEVVVAARAAMDWIVASTREITKAGFPLRYDSPLGFPVYQANRKAEIRMIDTQIGGRLQLRFATDTEELDLNKQKQASSPNLVHHADATHMMMVISKAHAEGIRNFAVIHDDFGVPACFTERFREIIREEFVRLHTDFDILGNFKAEHEKLGVVLPDIPPCGDLNLEAVLRSDYFFG